MFADDGYTQIRGEVSWNPSDDKWDWRVQVDHYGSTDDFQHRVEAVVGRHARRMAAQVGMAFRGPKIASIADVED